MTALKITLCVLGLAFTLFGYFIFFRKKFSLINDFSEDFKAGKKNETYAKRVGLIEFIIGIFLLVLSIVLVVFYWFREF